VRANDARILPSIGIRRILGNTAAPGIALGRGICLHRLQHPLTHRSLQPDVLGVSLDE
jgi:hypothetical protein